MLQTVLQLPFPVVSDISEIRPEKVVTYAIAGAAYNLSGYSNAFSKSGENWSFNKAKRAILLGIITGSIVAIMDPDAGPTAAAMEKWAYLAPAVLDQLISAWNNFGKQIENNQFGEMTDDWFEDGRQAQRGDLEIDASDEYFDAVAPDDMEMSEDDGGDGDSDEPENPA